MPEQPPETSPQADWDSWVDADPGRPQPVPVPADVDAVRPRSPGPLPLVETAFLASTAALIWLINYYFPLGPVLRIFFPLPMALLYLRWGRRSALMGTLVTALLLAVLMGPTRGVLFLMPIGALGLYLGSCWRRQRPWLPVILGGTLIEFAGFFFRLAVLSLLLGEDLWVYLNNQIVNALDWISGLLGLFWTVQLGWVEAIACVAVAVSGLCYLFVVHLVAAVLLPRLGSQPSPPPAWVRQLLDTYAR